jgi:DNA repair exonuclease SbcCD ATPase subunit
MAMTANSGTKLQSNKFVTQINQLEASVQKEADSAKRMQAHFELAQLYLSYKNPVRNYQKALKHLQIYASLNSESADQHGLRNWLSALKEIERLSEELNEKDKNIKHLGIKLKKLTQEKIALENKNKAFKNANVKLIQKNSKLEASNTDLAEKIEMLKNLDRRVEQKRKNLTN